MKKIAPSDRLRKELKEFIEGPLRVYISETVSPLSLV